MDAGFGGLRAGGGGGGVGCGALGGRLEVSYG